MPPKNLSRGLSAASLLTTGGLVFSLRAIPRYISPLVVKVAITKPSPADSPPAADVYFLSAKEFEVFERLHSPGGEESQDEEARMEELLGDNEEVTLPYLIKHDLKCDSWIKDALLVGGLISNDCLVGLLI